jgi:hypothetical protein
MTERNMTLDQRAIEWLLGGDTGISSKTILSVMTGIQSGEGYTSVPSDPSDFGRCYRLLFRFPEWRKRLPEVAKKYPAWGPLIREWDAMTEAYEAAQVARITHLSELYDHMQLLIDEGRLADGWEKVGTGSWRKKT